MKRQRIDYAALTAFCAEVSMFLGAGLPAAECFRLLAAQAQTDHQRQLPLFLEQRLNAGDTLCEAMEQSGAFPPLLLQMARAGQMTGRLEEAFSSLSAYCAFRVKLQKDLRGAVAYPLLLTAVMLAALFVILTQVVPGLAGVYAQLGAAMTPLASALLRIGSWLGAHWRVLAAALAVVAAAAALAVWAPGLRRRCTAAAMQLFFRTKTGECAAEAVFANLISLAYSGGLGFAEALSLSDEMFSGAPVQARVARCRAAMAEGASFDEAAGAAGLLDPLCGSLLSAGVRTGRTEQALRQITERTGAEAAAAVERLVSSVEPVLVIVLSVLAGVLLLSVILPLLGLLAAM